MAVASGDGGGGVGGGGGEGGQGGARRGKGGQGGARGALAPTVKKLPLKNNRNQNTYLNILGSFRYGVV